MLRAASLASLGLAGCATPADITQELNDYVSLLNDTNALLCSCPDDLGYASVVECDEALGTVGDSDRTCVESALEGEDEANEYLRCANSALEVFEQCLELNSSCEPGEHTACQDGYSEELAMCDQVSSAAVGAISQCVAA